jgi:hypothetical protein
MSHKIKILDGLKRSVIMFKFIVNIMFFVTAVVIFCLILFDFLSLRYKNLVPWTSLKWQFCCMLKSYVTVELY